MNRILILDDDQAVLNCFLVVLTQTQRFEVEVLSDSTKAFETIAAGNFDLHPARHGHARRDRDGGAPPRPAAPPRHSR